MDSPPCRDDGEIAAIAASVAALSTLPDPDARRRVLSYLLARSLPESPALRDLVSAEQTKRELPGIACLTETGELRVTVRDLKAKSGLDAAVRLAKVAIYAHELLAGQPLSSRRGLTPLLKQWGLYNGNTRARLARERGIVRSGDDLSLDDHARRSAERLVREMRSPVQRVEQRQDSAKWGPSTQEPADRSPEPSESIAHTGRTFEDFENWDNFAHRCSVGLHAVDRQGTILWANDTELKYLGYEPHEYIGRFIGDFHLDQDVVQDILRRLIGGETINAYPVRMRAKDGSPRYVMLNSNVYRRKGGEFGHSRCFSVGIDEATWKALKEQWEKKRAA